VIDRADAVVIGSGGLGAATAFALAQRGVRQVALIDRFELGSQTSPRAAGMVSYMRKGDLMIGLVKLAGERIRSFSGDTGQPLDWVASGSLKVARRPQDAEVLEADFERGARLGLDVELITPSAAHRLNPFLETDGIEAVLRVGDDMYFDPAQVATGFARGAKRLGATLLAHTTVTSVIIEDHAVTGVETTRGPIEAPMVVDAAGAWTRQVAEMSGIRVPLVPTRQQLFVTQPIAGARPDLPMVRVMDAAVYVRPYDGGFLWGVYEADPRFFDMDEFGDGFQIRDMPLDADVLWSAADDVAAQLPILRQAVVREHRGGIPTMTADGQLIVGPAPSVDGFFFASGCNVAGLSISPAIGEMLASWIIDGEPPTDLTPLTLSRFADTEEDEADMREDAAWQYRHFYGAV
jgi:4-methylaminobutanoate oxidase (formaldehyde-forming)